MRKLLLLLFTLLTSVSAALAQLTSISDGTLTSWQFQRVNNDVSGWIDSDFKNNGATEATAAVIKFESAGETDTYYMVDAASGKYIYASATTKSGSASESRLAKGGTTLPASEDDEQTQENNLKAYKWIVAYHASVDGKAYGNNVWDIAPKQNASLRLALWSQTADSNNNIILFDSKYDISYFRFYKPSVGALITANQTVATIKAQGYTANDIAEYYKPTKLDVVGWPTTAAWNTFKTAINALADDAVVATASATPYQTMCTTVITPQVGKFYTIYQPTAGKYIHAVTPDNKTELAANSDGTAASAIFYIPYSGRFLAYLNGYAMVGNKIYNGPYESGGYQTYTINRFSGHPMGTLRIKGGDYLAADASNDHVWTSQYGEETSKNWLFTEVTSLPVTIGSSGYATLYSPVALEVPEGVTAFWGENSAVDDAILVHAIKTGEVIPANNGVVLYTTTPETYGFDITTESGSISGTNVITGTVTTKARSGEYTLQIPSAGGTPAFFGDGPANLQGFKAYLPSGSSYVMQLIFDEETVVKAIEAAMNPGKVVYDMNGRRVENPSKGLYIVNGKKVIIK